MTIYTFDILCISFTIDILAHKNMLLFSPTSHRRDRVSIQEAFRDAVGYFLRVSIRPSAFHCCLEICIRFNGTSRSSIVRSRGSYVTAQCAIISIHNRTREFDSMIPEDSSGNRRVIVVIPVSSSFFRERHAKTYIFIDQS